MAKDSSENKVTKIIIIIIPSGRYHSASYLCMEFIYAFYARHEIA